VNFLGTWPFLKALTHAEVLEPRNLDTHAEVLEPRNLDIPWRGWAYSKLVHTSRLAWMDLLDSMTR